MKFLFISICLLSDFPFLKGTKELQHILLRFSFPSLYNSYHKFCCKLYPGGCYQLLDSSGYTCDLLRGRVTITQQNGWIEFEISNVQTSDAGYYRCGILGAQTHVYSDYYVQVFEAANRYSHTQPALTATIKGPDSSTTIPDSTVLRQDHGDFIRAPWSFGLPLIAVVSITGTFFIILLIGAVYYKLKVKHRKSGPLGRTRSESLKQEVPEKNNIVYSTVDFRPQRPEEVYENLRTQNGRAEHDGMVEYSTLAIQE